MSSTPVSPNPAPSNPVLSGRVLLVEDNPVNQMVAMDLLTALGLQVDTAAHGQEALAKLAAHVYDIVLMDCQMPVLDGYGATVAWRKQEADENRVRTPIAAITANALPSDRKRCLDCGMDDYLAKPYRREDLLGMLMKWLPAAQ